MSSYFNLILDTTPPQLTITSPSFCLVDEIIEVYVYSNEALSIWQDIYIIDNSNIKHELTFSRTDDYTYFGYVDLTGYPLGITTIHANLRDDVFNTARITRSIVIQEMPDKLNTEISIKDKRIRINIVERFFNIDFIERPVSYINKERNPSIYISTNREQINIKYTR